MNRIPTLLLRAAAASILLAGLALATAQASPHAVGAPHAGIGSVLQGSGGSGPDPDNGGGGGGTGTGSGGGTSSGGN